MIDYIKFSVIIPVYNTKRYVQRAIDSVVNQTYTNLEIIIIDDGSTDGSAEIIDRYAQRDARIKVIHQNNYGVSVARNCGLRISTGDYIGFLDSDDWLELDTYQNAYEVIKTYNADIYVFELDIWNKQNNCDDRICLFNNSQAITEQIRGVKFCYSMSDKIFSKRIISNLQFKSGLTMGEDLLFSWHAILRANIVVYKNKMQYHYDYRDESACNKKFTLSQMTDIDVWAEIYQSCKCQTEYASCALYKYVEVIVSRCSKMLKANDNYKKEYYVLRDKHINSIFFRGIFSKCGVNIKVKLFIYRFFCYEFARKIARIGDYI